MHLFLTAACGQGSASVRLNDSLRDNIKILQKVGADFVAVPCNSVHYFMPTMRGAVQIPVLSIVEETAKAVRERKLSKILLLATTFTANQGVYDNSFSTQGIELIKPNRREQHIIEHIIVRVEGGKRLRRDKQAILKIIGRHRKLNGVEGVVAGCTEIPLLLNQAELEVPLFDTIDVLASESYELITGRRNFANPRD